MFRIDEFTVVILILHVCSIEAALVNEKVLALVNHLQYSEASIWLKCIVGGFEQEQLDRAITQLGISKEETIVCHTISMLSLSVSFEVTMTLRGASRKSNELQLLHDESAQGQLHVMKGQDWIQTGLITVKASSL